MEVVWISAALRLELEPFLNGRKSMGFTGVKFQPIGVKFHPCFCLFFGGPPCRTYLIRQKTKQLPLAGICLPFFMGNKTRTNSPLGDASR